MKILKKIINLILAFFKKRSKQSIHNIPIQLVNKKGKTDRIPELKFTFKSGYRRTILIYDKSSYNKRKKKK